MFLADVDGKAPIVLPFVGKKEINITVNGTCYLELLKGRFVYQPLEMGAGGCRTAPRHTVQQKLKVFLLKGSRAE